MRRFLAVGVMVLCVAVGIAWWVRVNATNDLVTDARARSFGLQDYLDSMASDSDYCTAPDRRLAMQSEMERRKYEAKIATSKARARLAQEDPRNTEFSQMAVRASETESAIVVKCFGQEIALVGSR